MNSRKLIGLLSGGMILGAVIGSHVSSPHPSFGLSAEGAFEIVIGGKTYVCGDEGGVWVGGSIVRSNFTSYGAQMSALKAKIKKLSGSKKTKALAKMKKLKTAKKITGPYCIGGPGAATPQPTQPPTSGGTPAPTARPTATPPPSGACPNPSGLYGIPSGVTGHKSNGTTIWNNSCAGCHGAGKGDKAGSSYSKISGSRLKPDMLAVMQLLSNSQNVADLTAHLNCP